MNPKITDELIEEHGLSKEEHKRILSILGRDPTIAELGNFSVMWSEHASYKIQYYKLKHSLVQEHAFWKMPAKKMLV